MLTPRKSFALWKETVGGRSKPWLAWQLEAAQSLRGAILGIIVKKASEVKQLNTDLTQAVRSRDDFLSVASHELKTPLTTLLLQVQTLLRTAKKTDGDLPRERVLPKLELAENQARRLEQLIENLMDVSRIAAGRLTMHNEEDVNLSEITDLIVNTFRPEFTLTNRKLLCNVQPNVRGYWDPSRIQQVITNLISNALKYGGTEPVEVTIEDKGGLAVISVADRGIGISPDKVNRIFERFERAVSEHNYKGLGLGLWIARQIVEAMEGTISVQTKFGNGSKFIVEIPMKPSSLKKVTE